MKACTATPVWRSHAGLNPFNNSHYVVRDLGLLDLRGKQKDFGQRLSTTIFIYCTRDQQTVNKSRYTCAVTKSLALPLLVVWNRQSRVSTSARWFTVVSRGGFFWNCRFKPTTESFVKGKSDYFKSVLGAGGFIGIKHTLQMQPFCPAAQYQNHCQKFYRQNNPRQVRFILVAQLYTCFIDRYVLVRSWYTLKAL